jgi:hypothetical protein
MKIQPRLLLIRPLSVGVIAVCCLACGSTTEVTGSWKNPEVTLKPVHTVLVTALTGRNNARQTVETDLANALQKDGIKSIRSLDILPPSFTSSKEPDKEALLKKIKGSNVDVILTVALIDQTTESRYVPGSYGYAPMTRFGYYGRFWGYYTNWYPTLYSPGYYTEDKTYFLETNLYDAHTEELIWSAQSESYNPSSLDRFSKEFAATVLNEMKKDGLIQK